MSEDLKVSDVLRLFNAIDEVLDLVGLKDERHHAPEIMHDKLQQIMVSTARAFEPDALKEDNDRLRAVFRKFVELHKAALIVRDAPVGLGRAGAGKGR